MFKKILWAVGCVLCGAALVLGRYDAAPPAGAAVQITAGTTGSASAGSSGQARCPLKPSSTIPSGAAWAFTDSGLPSQPHGSLSSSYTHGRGDWGNGRGSGTVCHEDTRPGRGAHDLVLTIAGTAHLSTGITRLGHPGVGLVLNAKVSASDDTSCRAGTPATVTLFASYFEVHRDSVGLRFSGGCSAYDFTFVGPQLRVIVADNGKEVKSSP